MWQRSLYFLMSASLLFGMVLVKQAHAENVAQPVPSIIQLYLDSGFMGRDVDLDLQQIGLRARFKNGDIPAPGVLNVIKEIGQSTTTANGEPMFGYAWRLAWSTNSAYVPTSVLVTLSDAGCGAQASKHCAIQETYKGSTTIIKPENPVSGQATAKVHMESVVRLVEVAGYMTQGDASWYAYKGCNCAASPDFPKGTYVLVTRLDDPSRSVVVRINDWGPERDIFPKRVIDLDKVAFSAIGNPRGGIMQVKVLPLAPTDPLAIKAKAAETAVAPTTTVTKTTTTSVTSSGTASPGWSI